MKERRTKLKEIKEEVIDYLRRGMHYHARTALNRYIKETEK